MGKPTWVLFGALFLSTLALAFAEEGNTAVAVSDEDADSGADSDLASLVEAGVSLPNEFTICLKERPMMCLAPAADLNTDGTLLSLADRLRTRGQRFRLENGVLKFAENSVRVISAEHGAQKKVDEPNGGRVWIWKKQDLNYDQQWNANEDMVRGHAQICMRAFPKACLYTNYPTENKVMLANSDMYTTLWVVRPVDPCKLNPCDKVAKCSGLPDGNAKCTCAGGYTLGTDNKCYEINICANPDTNPCDTNADCVKTGPAKARCVCNKGYQGTGMKGKCQEINLCKAKVSPCDKFSECSPVGPAAFKCTCKPGYVATSFTTCAELDLCATANPCAPQASCKKIGPGKVACTCKPGFAGNGQSCVEVDGCAGTPCGQHATCLRQPLGARQCNCDAGYEPNKKSKQFQCIEVNPCAAKPCKGRNTLCKKIAPGKHQCNCLSGYLAFWNGNCEKPGSKEALNAAAEEGNEAARQELIKQKAKAKEAEERRKQIEREFRQKQKEREENIRALERRIRELIRARTDSRVADRDRRIDALGERIALLQDQQHEAAKLADAQLKFITQLSKQETEKATRLNQALEQATSKIAVAARLYAERLRDQTRASLAAHTDEPEPEAAPPPPAPKEPRKVSLPPRYGPNTHAMPLKLPVPKPTPKFVKAPNPIKPAPAAPSRPRFAEIHTAADANANADADADTDVNANTNANANAYADAEAEVEANANTANTANTVNTVNAATVEAVDSNTAITTATANADSVVEADTSAEELSQIEAHEAHEAHANEELEFEELHQSAEEEGQEQSDEDLANQLAALHNEVDSHLETVLAGADEVENDESDESDAVDV